MAGMFKILHKPLRFALKLSIESLVAAWVMKNRKSIAEKFSKKDKTDPDRPIGDRYVPIQADRSPSPFESAMADSAPPLTPAIETQLKESASHVRIDASESNG